MSTTEAQVKFPAVPVAITFDLTYEVLENLIVSAMEGGSNYWYWLHHRNKDVRKILSPQLNGVKMVGEPIACRIAAELLCNPEFTVEIYDAEDPAEKLGDLNMKNMIRGLDLAAKKYPDIFGALFDENSSSFDAGDADVIFQLCVLGDVVYG